MSGATDVTARNSCHRGMTDCDGVIGPVEGLRAFQLSSSDPLYTAQLDSVPLPISRFSQEGRRRRLERAFDLSRSFGKTYTLRPLYHLFNRNEDDVSMSATAAGVLDEMGADELSSRYDQWVIDLRGDLDGGSEGYRGTIVDSSAGGWPLTCERPYCKFTGSVVSLSALSQAKIELLRSLENDGCLPRFDIHIEGVLTAWTPPPMSTVNSGHRGSADTADAELDSDVSTSLRPGFATAEIQRGITVARDDLQLHGGSKPLGTLSGKMCLGREGEWWEVAFEVADIVKVRMPNSVLAPSE
ncbi:hypothetical protein EHS25_007596 [Saitozyma podzolica]|uniref:Uncharacterized protein n=1 Tax=Saitozyma podzolica TaxID=1890683 RepID=A0A427YQ73_9TREE|nr:hypothetical protein EHS25_007596 [Saitozyma podzolica]